MKRAKVVAVVLTALIVVVLALPAMAYAGGDQVQYGHPATDMPFAGGEDRTDGDWGNPSNNG